MDCDEIIEVYKDDQNLPKGYIIMEDCSFSWKTISAAEHDAKYKKDVNE